MYPNQQPGMQPPQGPPPQQPQFQPLPDQAQFSPSYLDEIAAPVQQKKVSPFLLWGMIGGVLLVAIIFIMLLASSGGPSSTERITSLLTRIQSLKTTTQDSAKNIKDSKLRASNSSLASILSGMENEFTTYLTSSGAKPPKAAKDSPISSEFSLLSEKLDDARLNERFDTVYTREVSYQIKQIRSEFIVVYDDIKSKEFRATLVSEDKSLEDLGSDFSKFNSN